MSDILGKWQQPEGERYPGLYFEFFPDGTYRAAFDEMGITSSGIYITADDLIDMEQTQHTMNLLGKFEGHYQVKGDTLIMALGDLDQPRPESLEHKNKRHYKKV